MLEFCRYRYRSGNSPSGVPFLEVLEFECSGGWPEACPSGVPFLEVLELRF